MVENLPPLKLQNPLPWDGAGGALIKHLLVDMEDTPAAFVAVDFLHVWHAGVGLALRLDFTASAFIYEGALWTVLSPEGPHLLE